MLSRNERAKQRWQGHMQALDHWLEERQQLLVKYCQLAGLPPYDKASKGLPTVAAIQSFCEVLVDYVSTGHFEVYEQLISEAQQSADDASRLIEQVFPLIATTTGQALDFNDKYAEVNEHDDMGNFDRDLSALGEAIEVRMELEDKLLYALENHDILASANG